MSAAPNCALYVGEVAHLRLRPRRHALRHRLFLLLLDLDEIDAWREDLRRSAWGRLGVVGFDPRDHGDGSATPLRAQIEARLAEAGFFGVGSTETGAVRLLCLPRVFGWVFNPIGVYFVYDRQGELAAVLYEVSSTFGERHTYAVAADADARGIVRQRAAKRLHVSPFMDMAQQYAFRLRPPDAQPGSPLTIGVDVGDAEGPILYASFSGRRAVLSPAALFAAWRRHPLLTLGVIAAIHAEAVKLIVKGLRPRAGPRAPDPPLSVGVSVAPGVLSSVERRRRVAPAGVEPPSVERVDARDAVGSPLLEA